MIAAYRKALEDQRVRRQSTFEEHHRLIPVARFLIPSQLSWHWWS